MAYLIVTPEQLTAAATDLARIGSTLSSAHAVAAEQTTAIVAAGTDGASGTNS